MRLGLSVVLGLYCALAVLLLAPAPARGAALTARFRPHEKSCYYAWVDQAGEKVGFYYAVERGGDFRVAYSVHDPSDKSVIEEPSARQVDIIFTADKVGEYVFCFYNGPHDKLVSFDITVESEPRLELPATVRDTMAETTSPLQDSLASLRSKITAIERTQRFFRTRESRNAHLILNTQYRILWYSLLESASIVGMSFAQVAIVRHLFNRNHYARFRV